MIEIKDKKITPTGQVGVDKNESVDSIRELIKEADVVVVEDFLVRPKKARRGAFDYSNMVAPRVIGKIEEICAVQGKTLVKQQSSLKPPAYGFAGMKYVKGKQGQHWQDAFAHACYYAVNKLDASPVSS